MSKVKMFSGLFITAVMSISVVSPSLAGAHGYKNRDKGPNIVEKAIEINESTGEFSTLIAAVSCTDLIDTLQRKHRRYTVFAPTDAAFEKAGLNASNVCSAFDRHTLTNILEYHVTRRGLEASEVLSRRKLHMLSGDKAYISGATVDGQNIIQTDVKVRNGIIHVIDGVMLP